MKLSSEPTRRFEGFLTVIVLIGCVGTIILFSVINWHWFDLFGELGRLKPLRYRAIDLRGVWGVLAISVGVVVVSAGLTPLIVRRPIPMAERVLWTGLVTTAVASLPTVVLAIFGALYEGTLLAALAVIAVAALALVASSGSLLFALDWWRAPTALTTLGTSWSGTRLWRWIAIGYLVLMAFALVIHGVTTPVTDNDALIYHAAMAKILVSAHGMPLIAGPSPGLEMSANYPPLFPALGAFTLLFAHGNDIFLRALGPVAAIGTAGAAYAIGRRLGGTMLGLLAAVFTLTAQIVSLYAVFDTAYAFMGLYAAMAFLALIMYVSERGNAALVLLGLSLGFLLLCSYQGAIYLVWLPVVGWLVWRLAGWRRAVTGAVSVIVPLSLVGGFWYVRNWVVLGNPVYPWYHNLFGGRELASPLTSLAQASVTDVARTLAFTAQGPSVFLDLLGILFTNRNFFPALSPIAVLGFIVAFRGSTRRSPERTGLGLIIFCAVLPIALFIANGTFFFRYFIPAIPILAVLPAYAFRHLALALPGHHSLSNLNRRVAGTILIYSLVFPGTFVLLAGANYYEYFGFQPQQAFLYSWTSFNPNPKQEPVAGDLAGDAAFDWIQQHLSRGARVATYESRIYYLFNADWRRFFFLDGFGVDPIWNQTNPKAVARYLRANGVQYVWLSDIIEVGSAHLPLVRSMVGNTPEFPELWQYYGDVMYGVGPMLLRTGESPNVTMSNAAMWSRVKSINGSPARAVLSRVRAPIGYADPAGVLVANGKTPGLVSFQYLTPRHVTSESYFVVDISTHRTRSVTTHNTWQLLVKTQLSEPGTWHTGFVKIKSSQSFGVTRLGFRTSDGPMFVRRVKFIPRPTHAAVNSSLG